MMRSANRLTDAKMLPKFKGNTTKCDRDMEWTQNARLKLVTFSCDLDLDSAWLSNRFSIAF